jgi:anti-sigma factor RsiW
MMKETQQRPVCHRAEDLVSYLYGESSAADAIDFRDHLQQCDACRSEFSVFRQVHDSIQVWRSEALGASLNPTTGPVIASTPFIRSERKLSAMAALRQFFSVSPLWLRGATAFAALLLFVLSIAMVARISRKPVQVAGNVKSTLSGAKETTYTQEQVQNEIEKAVARTRVELANLKNESSPIAATKDEPHQRVKRTQVAVNQPRNAPPRGLNRQEREQLAADLRLTSLADEDESLLALPEQDNPNQ